MKRALAITLALLASSNLLAGDKSLRETNEYYQKPLDELLQTETPAKAEVGSRSGAREALEAVVPIDVITSAQLESSGYTELGKALTKLLPGFNFPRPSIADGTDHALPFTLRGLNPDQVLVLVNGKRLHQSSLLNVNATVGRGSSGVDINTIPLRAIEKIEVLRDGAAAQYGSDAIAGIVNIILKGSGYGSSVTATYGRTSQGDGAMRQGDVFFAIPLKNDGFFNITAEARDRSPTNRAGGDRRDNYRINHMIGDADTQDGLLSFNAELPGDYLTYYGHGLLDRRNSSEGALYRLATDSRNNTNIYPDGFLPMIQPKIEDYSASFGVRGISFDNVRWDLSYTHGYNDFHFYVANSQNDSLGDTSPTSFDSGATAISQDVVNLGLVKKLGDLNLAGGVEYRHESYQIRRGEEASYALGTASNNAGAQGFPGFQPQNEVDASRDNRALYIDARYDVSRALTIEGAARQERYSDFGSNLDGKLALAFRPHDDFLIRASSSTGFRAPSLSQSYYTATVSKLFGGSNIYQVGTFGVNNPVAIALGAQPLKPETSTHRSLGVVYQPASKFSLSADYFNTAIDSRIMLTDNIIGSISDAVNEALNQHGVQYARYFTNAIATETQGLDLRLNYQHDFEGAGKIKTFVAYHRDRTRITNIYPMASILGEMTPAAVNSTHNSVEDSQPGDAVKIWAQYDAGNYRATANLNRFGSYMAINEITPKWTLDLDLAFRPSHGLELAIGGENILNAMPDKHPNTGSHSISSDGVRQYPNNSPFGINGAFYYVRLVLKI